MWLTSSERSGAHHDPLVFSLACGRRLDRASVKPLNQKDPQPRGRGLNEGNCDALHAGETTHMTERTTMETAFVAILCLILIALTSSTFWLIFWAIVYWRKYWKDGI
jgi:hypothetical protein